MGARDGERLLLKGGDASGAPVFGRLHARADDRLGLEVGGGADGEEQDEEQRLEVEDGRHGRGLRGLGGARGSVCKADLDVRF